MSEAAAARENEAAQPLATARARVYCIQRRIVFLFLPSAGAARPRQWPHGRFYTRQPCAFYLTIPPKDPLLQPRAKKKMDCGLRSRKPKKLHEPTGHPLVGWR